MCLSVAPVPMRGDGSTAGAGPGSAGPPACWCPQTVGRWCLQSDLAAILAEPGLLAWRWSAVSPSTSSRSPGESRPPGGRIDLAHHAWAGPGHGGGTKAQGAHGGPVGALRRPWRGTARRGPAGAAGHAAEDRGHAVTSGPRAPGSRDRALPSARLANARRAEGSQRTPVVASCSLPRWEAGSYWTARWGPRR
jgi:hypothetical protein